MEHTGEVETHGVAEGYACVLHRLRRVSPVLESCHESTLLVDEMHHVTDVHLFEGIEKGMIYCFTARCYLRFCGEASRAATRVLKCPTTLFAPFFNLEMLVLTRDDTLIDFGNALFKSLLKRFQMLLARAIARDIILETAEADTVPTENIAGFQTIAQKTIDQELITIWEKTFLSLVVLSMKIAFGPIRDELDGE